MCIESNGGIILANYSRRRPRIGMSTRVPVVVSSKKKLTKRACILVRRKCRPGFMRAEKGWRNYGMT